MSSTENKVRCIKCQYYYITWDKKCPYGCRKIGFKSPIEPALVVFRNSGSHCKSFQPKN